MPSEERVMRVREEIERDIRIAIWNAGKWQGKPDEVAQSLIRKAMAEPTMVRALNTITAFADEGSGIGGVATDAQAVIDSLKEIMAAMMAAGINLTPVSKAIELLSLSPDIDRSGIAQEVE